MDIIGVTTIFGRPGVPSEELRYIIRLRYDVYISEAYDDTTGSICYDLPEAFERYTPSKLSPPHKAYLLTTYHETE
jgi:hypothetical protein